MTRKEILDDIIKKHNDFRIMVNKETMILSELVLANRKFLPGDKVRIGGTKAIVSHHKWMSDKYYYYVYGFVEVDNKNPLLLRNDMILASESDLQEGWE